MKQVTTAVLIVLSFLFTSCEKEYTCNCKEINTSTGKVNKYWNPTRQTFTSSSDASAWCHGNEISGFGIRIECELK